MSFVVTSSPHIRSNNSTKRIMCDVVISLLPALAVSVWVFGLRALLVAAVSASSAFAAEKISAVLFKQKQTVFDGSAIVTGLLLAMTLPATVPYSLAAIGSVFAILFAKVLSGGLGRNVFNPALAGRAFLMLLWPAWLVRYAAPGTVLPIIGTTVDITSSATPLHHMQMPALPEEPLAGMFLGTVGGSIGEVSAFALLIGGAYLVYRKIISIRIPTAYLLTVGILTCIFHKAGDPVSWMLYSLTGGGVILGAVFMATDYATSPVTPKGQILYGIGCGVLTVLYRYFGLFPEGVTYAILMMNAFVWMIDEYTAPVQFGTRKGGEA